MMERLSTMSTANPGPQVVAGYIARLREVFRNAETKHEGHARSHALMAEIARDPVS
jgi:hypothetical protein